MKHMSLEEWDKTIGPKLKAIKGRAVWIRVDANQILDWVKSIPAKPDFETEAMDHLLEAKIAIGFAAAALEEAIQRFEAKEKTS